MEDLTGSTRESYWRLRWSFFEQSGYQLRPKFGPTFTKHLKDLDEKALEEYEAYYSNRCIMDARRISDGKKVMFKRISTRDYPDEVGIALLFSSPPHAGNPRNHCIPILEVLQDPLDDDKQILVMPLLITFTRPRFDTVGEVVDCFRQIFEGIQYMHENFVAHRDCGINNILQDPTRLFPAGFYPMRPWWDFAADKFARTITRTQCWPRYYIIDFGLSRQYDPADGLPFEDVIRGGDKSPPEYKWVACNPFPTDIYVLGNLLKEKFLYSVHPDMPEDLGLRRRWRFLEPLVNDMIQPDHAKRPTIGEVIERFDELCCKLSSWHLRRPGEQCHPLGYPAQCWRQLKRFITRVAPVPPYTAPRAASLGEEMRAFYTITPDQAREALVARELSGSPRRDESDRA